MIYHGARHIDPTMQPFRPEQLAITVEKNGSRRFTKASHHQKSDALLQSFFEIKNKSRLPVFIYLIQRL